MNQTSEEAPQGSMDGGAGATGAPSGSDAGESHQQTSDDNDAKDTHALRSQMQQLERRSSEDAVLRARIRELEHELARVTNQTELLWAEINNVVHRQIAAGQHLPLLYPPGVVPPVGLLHPELRMERGLLPFVPPPHAWNAHHAENWQLQRPPLQLQRLPTISRGGSPESVQGNHPNEDAKQR